MNSAAKTPDAAAGADETTREEVAERLATIVTTVADEHGDRIAGAIRSMCAQSEREGLGTATETGFAPFEGCEFDVAEHWQRIMDASRTYDPEGRA